MTTVPNSSDAGRPARGPITREQILFYVAGVLEFGVTAPIRMHWSELPSGREFELQLPDDDRHAVNMFAAKFGLPNPTESDPAMVRGRRARRWYGASTAHMQQPLFGGWRIAVNCYVTDGPVHASVPAAAAQPGQVPA